MYYQEPTRAEGPKERPTAGGSTVSDQLSAHLVHAMSKYGTPQILRLSGFYITARATGTQEIEGERHRDRDVELFCSTPSVPWRQQPARPRIKVLQPAYSQGPSDEDPQSVDLYR